AWNVRACTPGTPRSLSRLRICPAARAVKVTASTLVGLYMPVATPRAMREVIARVVPVPAPARTHTGPVSCWATARWSSSRASSSASASGGAGVVITVDSDRCGDIGGRARGGGCGRGRDRAAEPLADQCMGDRDGAGRPDAAGLPVQVQLRTSEEPGFGDLRAVRVRGGVGGGAGEAAHQ